MLRINIEKLQASASSLNIRVEKHGSEEKVIGVDIDFNATVEANWLNQLAVDCVSDYATLMFDDNGEVKMTGIEKLTFDREYEEHSITITMDSKNKPSITMEDVTIKKISAVPEFGHKVKVHLQAQCHPTDKEHDFLRKVLLKDSVMIEVTEPVQGDLIETDAE